MENAISRSHAKSLAQKWTFILLHLAIVLFSLWLVLFDGLSTLGSIFNKEWSFSDPNRAMILLACTSLYFIRHIITLFYLLVRKVPWAEVFGLSMFIALFEIGLVLIGGGAFREYTIEFGSLDILAFALLIIGSYLNSFSELQRKWWKADQKNKGHLYTKGLFTHSMHINFFGDVVLFTGWSLFTYNFWTLGLPLLMLLSFIFFHIPTLDGYLRERYSEEFLAYEKRTKKLTPFVY
ncbi:MAG TPA: DUF1295 domain-containing protein [Campylobacterales bacterium]|nr:DUF1295 domain-containing protein [Campylobacterales bacterium]